MKCYIYTRVSTSIQVDAFSLDAQKEKLRRYAEFNEMVHGIRDKKPLIVSESSSCLSGILSVSPFIFIWAINASSEFISFLLSIENVL